MKKKIFIIISILLIITISVGAFLVFSPVYLESKYQSDKSNENLYNFCKYLYNFPNDEYILKYYPLLLFDNDFTTYSWEYEKDNMLTKFLETSLLNSNFEDFKKNLVLSCTNYSDATLSTKFVEEFIYDYYYHSNNLNNTYDLFEIVIENAPDLEYELTIYARYSSFVQENTNDNIKLTEINQRKELVVKELQQIDDSWK